LHIPQKGKITLIGSVLQTYSNSEHKPLFCSKEYSHVEFANILFLVENFRPGDQYLVFDWLFTEVRAKCGKIRIKIT
jgi:hypothetical protein